MGTMVQEDKPRPKLALFHGIAHAPLPPNGIHGLNEREALGMGHDEALNKTTPQAVVHFHGFELISVALIRQGNGLTLLAIDVTFKGL